jgi:hypothetical protein
MRVVLAALVAAALVPTALASVKPQVRLVAFSPARVAGSGFRARERVTVTVSSPSTRLRTTVRTSAGGSFLARFTRRARTSACNQVAVVAVGARGDRAAWKSPPQPCGAQVQPVTN